MRTCSSCEAVSMAFFLTSGGTPSTPAPRSVALLLTFNVVGEGSDSDQSHVPKHCFLCKDVRAPAARRCPRHSVDLRGRTTNSSAATGIIKLYIPICHMAFAIVLPMRTCSSCAAISTAFLLTSGRTMNSSAATSLSSFRSSIAMGLGPTPFLRRDSRSYSGAAGS